MREARREQRDSSEGGDFKNAVVVNQGRFQERHKKNLFQGEEN